MYWQYSNYGIGVGGGGGGGCGGGGGGGGGVDGQGCIMRYIHIYATDF